VTVIIPTHERRRQRMADEDLTEMTRAELVAEITKLRAAIRAHRDSSGHDLCWFHPALWGTLPESDDVAGLVEVPPWPQFMRGCVAFRTSLERELPEAPAWSREYDDPARD
jgi:hypothetical protein